MPTTWPSRTIEKWLSGSGAKTQGRDIFDRHMVLKSKPSGFPFAEVNHNTNTMTTKVSQRVLVPSYAQSGDVISISFLLRHSASTAYARIVESGGTTGSEVSAASTAYLPVTASLTIPDGTWAGAVKTFEVQLRNGGAGTSYAATGGLTSGMSTSLAGNFQVIG